MEEVPSQGELYSDRTEVNGIEMNVGWSEDYHDYTIYFPQIKLDDETRDKGVSDQVIRIGETPDLAQRVFEYASQLAETESDVNELYKKVLNFSREQEDEEIDE